MFSLWQSEKKTSKIFFMIIVIFILFSSYAFAEIVGIEGGVVGDPTMKDGEYEYEEMFFLTGKPIKLKGTVKVSNSKSSKSYSFSLYNTSENIELSRKVSFDVVNAVNESMHQTTSMMDINKITENISVNGKKYTLANCLYDGSELTDNTPAVDYFNGSLYAKKRYYINGDRINNEGVLTVEITGDNIIGYKHLWGESETKVLTYDMKFVSDPELKNSDTDWSGQVILKMNVQSRTRLEYSSTDPITMSFRGNYVKRTKDENILAYSYDLPDYDGDKLKKDSRNTGKKSLRRDVLTGAKSLITAKMRDIEGHWAQESIQKMTSLEILSPQGSFFDPDLHISRNDFARAISKSIANIKPYTKTELIKMDRKKDREPIFYDVSLKDPYFSYIEFVKNKELMVGKGNYFMGDKTLTRAEMIVVLVKALGMTHLAPTPPYNTIYTDDYEIPRWAKGSVYVATEIGLVEPYEDGGFHPAEIVTRAEAAYMLDVFLSHIKDNITYDYREKIINRY